MEPKKLGKHMCPDWDYLEIEPTDPEWGACLCDKDPKGAREL